MRRVTISVTAAGLFAALIGAASAQSADTYPDRPIKVVVPAAAGGVTDTPARLVTNRMRESIGQSVGGAPEVFANAMKSYIRDVSEIGRKNNLEIE